jgi:ribosome-binding ATPase YchF (GTP1/OBG family)
LLALPPGFIAEQGYQDLELRYFFTAGVTEVRCWTFLAGNTIYCDFFAHDLLCLTLATGSLAPQCAGCIHGDMERGFIKAEVCPVRIHPSVTQKIYLAINRWLPSKISSAFQLELLWQK